MALTLFNINNYTNEPKYKSITKTLLENGMNNYNTIKFKVTKEDIMEINRANNRDYLSNTNVSNQSKNNKNIDTKASITEENKSKDFDVHNATFDEFKGMIHDLHQSGEISFLELATYVFQPLKGNTMESGRQYNDCNKRDWIAEFRAKSASNLINGNTQCYIEDQKLLKILTD